MHFEIRLGGGSVVTAFECTRVGLPQLGIRLMHLQVHFQAIFILSWVLATKVGAFPWSHITVHIKRMSFETTGYLGRIGAGCTFEHHDSMEVFVSLQIEMDHGRLVWNCGRFTAIWLKFENTWNGKDSNNNAAYDGTRKLKKAGWEHRCWDGWIILDCDAPLDFPSHAYLVCRNFLMHSHTQSSGELLKP